jgi:membrane protein required for colicin V production
MNWLDIVILGFTGVGLIKGLFDGMIRQVFSLVAMVAGVYLCAGSAEWIRNHLTKMEWFPQQAVIMTSYVFGFLLIVGVILLAGQIVHRLVSATPLGIMNHIVGGMLGLLMMALFVSLAFNVIEMFDHQSVLLSPEIKVESRFYFYMKNIIPAFFPGNIFVLNS